MRKRTGKLQFSANAEVPMNRSMVYLLGTLKRAHDDKLDCAVEENYDECHFTFDQDDGKCLEFSGIKRLSYSAISSGRVGFTVCLRISGGIHCKIEAALVIF